MREVDIPDVSFNDGVLLSLLSAVDALLLTLAFPKSFSSRLAGLSLELPAFHWDLLLEIKVSGSTDEEMSENPESILGMTVVVDTSDISFSEELSLSEKSSVELPSGNPRRDW